MRLSRFLDGEEEGTALAHFAFEPNFTAISFHKFFAEYQPQSCALFVGRASCAIAGCLLEEHALNFGTNPNAIVSNRNCIMISFVFGSDGNLSSVFSELYTVEHQVTEHKGNHIEIGKTENSFRYLVCNFNKLDVH